MFIVRYDRMMADFDGMMDELLAFVGHEPDQALRDSIAQQAEKQRAYKSGHAYDLSKFGLSEDRIRQDAGFYMKGCWPVLIRTEQVFARTAIGNSAEFECTLRRIWLHFGVGNEQPIARADGSLSEFG